MNFDAKAERWTAHASSHVAPPPHRSWSRSDGDPRPALSPAESQALQQRLWAVIDGV